MFLKENYRKAVSTVEKRSPLLPIYGSFTVYEGAFKIQYNDSVKFKMCYFIHSKNPQCPMCRACCCFLHDKKPSIYICQIILVL